MSVLCIVTAGAAAGTILGFGTILVVAWVGGKGWEWLQQRLLERLERERREIRERCVDEEYRREKAEAERAAERLKLLGVEREDTDVVRAVDAPKKFRRKPNLTMKQRRAMSQRAKNQKRKGSLWV